MGRLISSVAACVFLVAAATPALSEDMMKSDLIQTGAVSSDTTTAAETKADCLQKAEMEQDSVKKAEMIKACDAIQ